MDRIAFFGTGIMGLPMATNLLAKGFAVVAYNRTREKAEPLRSLGARIATTPAECARDASVIILMVTNPEAVDALLFPVEGPGPLLQGRIVINMSTVPPTYTRELAGRVAAQGGEFVDAPVSGSVKPAQEGTLVILAGGEERVLDRCEPALLAMGRKVIRCGPAGSGSMMKICVNLLLGTMVAGLCETAALARAGGLEPRSVLDVVLSGPLQNDLFRLKAPMIAAGAFPAQFPLKYMAKDLGYALAEAADVHAKLPVGEAVDQAYARALEQGLGEEDFAALFRTLAESEGP